LFIEKDYNECFEDKKGALRNNLLGYWKFQAFFVSFFTRACEKNYAIMLLSVLSTKS